MVTVGDVVVVVAPSLVTVVVGTVGTVAVGTAPSFELVPEELELATFEEPPDPDWEPWPDPTFEVPARRPEPESDEAREPEPVSVPVPPGPVVPERLLAGNVPPLGVGVPPAVVWAPPTVLFGNRVSPLRRPPDSRANSRTAPTAKAATTAARPQ